MPQASEVCNGYIGFLHVWEIPQNGVCVDCIPEAGDEYVPIKVIYSIRVIASVGKMIPNDHTIVWSSFKLPCLCIKTPKPLTFVPYVLGIIDIVMVTH